MVSYIITFTYLVKASCIIIIFSLNFSTLKFKVNVCIFHLVIYQLYIVSNLKAVS